MGPSGRGSCIPSRVDRLSVELHAELDHANRTAAAISEATIRRSAGSSTIRARICRRPSLAVRMTEETVRRWLVRYQAEGLEWLKDAPRPGAPPRATRTYRERLLAVARRCPAALGLPFSLWNGDRLVADAAPANVTVNVTPFS